MNEHPPRSCGGSNGRRRVLIEDQSTPPSSLSHATQQSLSSLPESTSRPPQSEMSELVSHFDAVLNREGNLTPSASNHLTSTSTPHLPQPTRDQAPMQASRRDYLVSESSPSAPVDTSSRGMNDLEFPASGSVENNSQPPSEARETSTVEGTSVSAPSHGLTDDFISLIMDVLREITSELSQCRQEHARMFQRIQNIELKIKRKRRSKRRSSASRGIFNSAPIEQETTHTASSAANRNSAQHGNQSSSPREESPSGPEGDAKDTGFPESPVRVRDVGNFEVFLRTPSVPMTASKGAKGSEFVRTVTTRRSGLLFEHLGPESFVRTEGDNVKIECEMKANEKFRPYGNEKYPLMSYLGFYFPDETQLTYLPVRDFVIQSHGHYLDYRQIHVSLPQAVYQKLFETAKDAYKRAFRSEAKDLYNVTIVENRVFFNGRFTRDAEIFQGYRTISVFDAVKDGENSFKGDAIVGLRFSQKNNDDPRFQVVLKKLKLQ